MSFIARSFTLHLDIAIYPDQTEVSSADFLRAVHRICPLKIKTILTDNGTHKPTVLPVKRRRRAGSMCLIVRCRTEN